MEVYLFLSHRDTPRMERRLLITKLCKRCICGSRSTAASRPYKRVERTTKTKDAQLGGRLDLPLVPKDAVK